MSGVILYVLCSLAVVMIAAVSYEIGCLCGRRLRGRRRQNRIDQDKITGSQEQKQAESKLDAQ
jgi:hypothetical protein